MLNKKPKIGMSTRNSYPATGSVKNLGRQSHMQSLKSMREPEKDKMLPEFGNLAQAAKKKAMGKVNRGSSQGLRPNKPVETDVDNAGS